MALAACNLIASPATPAISPSPTPDAIPSATPGPPGDVPVIGAPDLEPSGAGPCVLSAGNQNVSIHSSSGDSAPVIAMLGARLGEIPFEFRDGWYAISWYVGSQEIVGWLPESLVQLKGECDYLRPPAVCSVESAVSRNIDVYAAPRRDSAVISVLGDLYTAPLVERSADGWFGIDAGNGQRGWIAPDEGRLVGC